MSKVREILEEMWKQSQIGFPPKDIIDKDKSISLALQKLRNLVEGEKYRHQRNGDDCGGCGLFNVVKGEVCDCEFNQAISKISALLGE